MAALLLVFAAEAGAQPSRALAGNVPSLTQQQPSKEEEEIKPSRPGVANPAEIPGPGVLQLEVGYDSNFHAKDVRSEQSAPLTIRFSAAKRLLLELSLENVKSQIDEQTRTRTTGAGDARIGFQVVGLEDTKDHPALGLAYYAKIPTADEEKGLGTGRFDHKLVVLLSKKLGEADVDFNVAYLLVGKECESGWEHGGQGALSISRDFKNNLGFEAELSGQSHNDVQPRGLFALGALRYKAGRRLAFDAGARFGLNPEAPRFGLFAGLTVGVTRPLNR